MPAVSRRRFHPRLRRRRRPAVCTVVAARRALLRRERLAAAAQRAGQCGRSARTPCRARSRASPACMPAAPAASGAARPRSWSRAAAGAWAPRQAQARPGLVSAASQQSEALPGISGGPAAGGAPFSCKGLQRVVRARRARGCRLSAHVCQKGAAVRSPRHEEGAVEQTHARVEAETPTRAVVQAAWCTPPSSRVSAQSPETS